jgi:topoisomerase IA-like protein
LTRLAAPPAFDVSQYKSDKKITDEEVLQILEQPLSKNAGKNKKKKKKTAKKAGEDDSSDEE